MIPVAVIPDESKKPGDSIGIIHLLLLWRLLKLQLIFTKLKGHPIGLHDRRNALPILLIFVFVVQRANQEDWANNTYGNRPASCGRSS